MKRARLLVVGLSLCLGGAALAAARESGLNLPGTRDQQNVSSTWAVRGGEASFMLHAGLSGELGLRMRGGAVRRVDINDVMAISIEQSSALEFDADAGMLQKLTGGSLQFRGALELSARGKTLDLSNFVLRPKAGTASDLELLDGQQKVWLDIDHVHYEALDENRRLSMRNMDLRITPALAQWLGDPALAGLAIGAMDMESEIFRAPGTVILPASCADPDWPGEPNSNGSGLASIADVLLESMSAFDYKGCQSCDGPGGASDGNMKFAPNATLRNSNNPLTADIPWYSKFSGNFPPYGNDQHPYFVWNVYRINADGQLDQIGRSGTKHAFLTTNTGCAENCGNSHILGPNCGDTYSSGNNESTSSLGPRSEIIPYKAQWARCGSGYDADCNGAIDSPIPYGAFDNRMLMRESEIEAASNPGAQYLFDGWYVVREDVNIFNTMGWRTFTPTFTTVWSATGLGAFNLGPALNAWVNHANPGSNARSVDIDVPLNGHLRVAMKATQLAGGDWRYDYVVMNYDYALVQTSGAEPNLRMLSSRGMTAFEVTAAKGAQTTGETFRDVDKDLGNNWTMSKPGTGVRWTAPASGNDLSWGTMFRFTLVGGAPVTGTVQVGASDGATFNVQVLVPSGAPNPGTVFANSFE